jgi:hypothetical protein
MFHFVGNNEFAVGARRDDTTVPHAPCSHWQQKIATNPLIWLFDKTFSSIVQIYRYNKDETDVSLFC